MSTRQAPRVTVLLPCFNAEHYLSACLDSTLTQTYTSYEVVAIDDGSSDRTWEILAHYSARHTRIRAVRNDANLGLVKTLNRGIGLSQGEYIARMDADDEMQPDRLETEVLFLDSHPAVDLVSTSALLIDSDGRVLCERRAWVTCPAACRFVVNFATPVIHPAVMARRQALHEFHYADEQHARHTEDYELWARMALAGKNIANIPRPLHRLRRSKGSVSARHEVLQVGNFLRCVQRTLRRHTGSPIPLDTVAVLANRMDFGQARVPLRAGLDTLASLAAGALAERLSSDERQEILDAAAIQKTEILVQCALKGRFPLRARALSLLLGAGYTAVRCRTVRQHFLGKLRERATRVLASRRGHE